jgi:hypothetical protein
VSGVDADRVRGLTLEPVEVESPTGDTAAVARLYARRLEELGLDVELLDDVFQATPTVVARLRGGDPGPTVVQAAISPSRASIRRRLASRVARQGWGRASGVSSARPLTPNRSELGQAWPCAIRVAWIRFFSRVRWRMR